MREDTRRWLRYAEYDLRMAELALEHGIYVHAAYHAQQAAEKYLKAYLIEHERPYPRTHDIKILIKKCAEIDKEIEELLTEGVDKLTIYATESRYPEADQEITKEEAEEAIKKAKTVQKLITQKLQTKNNPTQHKSNPN